MKQIEPASYFKGLDEVLLKTEVTGSKKEKLSINDGLEETIRIIVECASAGKKIVFIGNGGSASISSHISVDFWKNGGIRAIAFNDTSLLTCISNDFGFPYVFEKPIEMFMDKGDVLIAISSSGKSENILRGAKMAKSMNCPVITMSGFGVDNPLRSSGEINFYVPAPTGAYGFVEIAHMALCHCIVDLIIERKLIHK